MAQNYFTDAAVRKIVATVHGFERMIRNLDRRVGELSQRETRPGARPVWFRNHSGETIPPHSIVASDGIEQVEGVAGGVLKGVKPSTTFRDEYFATGDREVPPDGVAKIQHAPCFRLAYDTGTPAEREGWGPKPGQWTLAKGFPCTTKVRGVIDPDKKLLLGTLHPVTTLLCQATGNLAADASSTAYKILAGTLGSETDAGFTTVPPVWNYTDEVIANDDKFVAKWINSGWAVLPFLPGGEGNRRFKAELSSALSSASSTAGVSNVVALDGDSAPEISTVQNLFSLSGESGAAVLIEEDLSSETANYLLVQVKHVVREFMTALRYDTDSHKFQAKFQQVTVLHEADEDSEWTDIWEATQIEPLFTVYADGTELKKQSLPAYVLEQETPNAPDTIDEGTTCEEEEPEEEE